MAFGHVAERIGPQASLEWASRLGEGPVQNRLRAHAWFRMGLTASAENLESNLLALPPDALQSAGEAAAQGMLVGQGRAALSQWRQTAPPQLAGSLLVGGMEVLAAVNPLMAAKVLFAEPSGATRDGALDVLIQRTYRRDEKGRSLASSWLGSFHSTELKRAWEERLNSPIATSDRTLPDSLESGFEGQSWSEFRERLDLLSTFPLRATE